MNRKVRSVICYISTVIFVEYDFCITIVWLAKPLVSQAEGWYSFRRQWEGQSYLVVCEQLNKAAIRS